MGTLVLAGFIGFAWWAGRVVDETGQERTVRAPVVVDASGQSSLIMSRLGLREWDPVLNKAALWTYFEGAYRDTGRDEGATMVIQTEGRQGWFWYIPVAQVRTK